MTFDIYRARAERCVAAKSSQFQVHKTRRSLCQTTDSMADNKMRTIRNERILNSFCKARTSSRTLKVFNGQLSRNRRNVCCWMALSPEPIPEANTSPQGGFQPLTPRAIPLARGVFYLRVCRTGCVAAQTLPVQSLRRVSEFVQPVTWAQIVCQTRFRAAGCWVVAHLPADARGQAHQDRFGAAARLQTKQRAAIPD